MPSMGFELEGILKTRGEMVWNSLGASSLAQLGRWSVSVSASSSISSNSVWNSAPPCPEKALSEIPVTPASPPNWYFPPCNPPTTSAMDRYSWELLLFVAVLLLLLLILILLAVRQPLSFSLCEDRKTVPDVHFFAKKTETVGEVTQAEAVVVVNTKPVAVVAVAVAKHNHWKRGIFRARGILNRWDPGKRQVG